MSELALQTSATELQDRRAAMVARLGSAPIAWPAKALQVTAVDVDSGELQVFSSASEVDLTDAVCASCAIPGVWPVVPIKGRRYMDGGAWRTADNAHLARGASSVLIVSPFGAPMGQVLPALEQDVAELRAGGSQVTLICAEPLALASAVLGPLNPAVREPAARAGRAQARRVSAQLKAAS